MDTELVPRQDVTIVATPNGLILSTPKGQFMMKSTSGETTRSIDPASFFGLTNSDPRQLTAQALELGL